MAKKTNPASQPEPVPKPDTSGELRGLANPALPTIWLDSIQVMARTDGVVMLRMFGLVPPNNMVEVARMMTPVEHLKQMAEAFQNTLKNISDGKVPPQPPGPETPPAQPRDGAKRK